MALEEHVWSCLASCVVMILLERAGLLPIDSGIARHGTGAGLWSLISVLKEMLSAPAFSHSGPASDSLLGRDR